MEPHADAKEDRVVELIPPIRPVAPCRVVNVEALPGFLLRVRFNDGTEGTVEMAEFIKSDEAGVFAILRDEKLFRRVGVSLGAVTWPGGLDLAPDAKERGKWIIA